MSITAYMAMAGAQRFMKDFVAVSQPSLDGQVAIAEPQENETSSNKATLPKNIALKPAAPVPTQSRTILQGDPATQRARAQIARLYAPAHLRKYKVLDKAAAPDAPKPAGGLRQRFDVLRNVDRAAANMAAAGKHMPNMKNAKVVSLKDLVSPAEDISNSPVASMISAPTTAFAQNTKRAINAMLPPPVYRKKLLTRSFG